MITIDKFLDLIPNNFTMDEGTNNRKYFEAFTAYLNRISIDLEAETVNLLTDPPSGSDHAGLDAIGSSIGINRQGLSNSDYAKLINLYKDVSDYYKIKSWDDSIDNLVGYEWITGGAIDVGVNTGALLDSSRKLSGTKKLLGGRRVGGRFVPNVSAVGTITLFLQGAQEDKKPFISKFYKSREPFGVTVEVVYQ